MKDLMTKQNLMFVGIGLATAFVVYKVLVNREKTNEIANTTGKPVMKSNEESSDFCGCGAQLIGMEIFEEFFGSENQNVNNDNIYPKAGVNASRYVQKAIQEFRKLPNDVKGQKPLLYWLLGSGTPPYKMTKKDSAYQGKSYRGQNCNNCRFTFMRWVNEELICSQIQGNIELDHWCKLWASGDTVNPKPIKQQ